MEQQNAPISFPSAVVATKTRVVNYSIVANSNDKAEPGSVPGAGKITNVSLSILGDDSAGVENIVLIVRSASGVITNTTNLVAAPVAVPSALQASLSIPVAAGDFFVVSYGNTTNGFIGSLVTIELDEPI